MKKWNEQSIQYKLANNLRSRLYSAIQNKAKVGSAVADLGCSIEYLIEYLEKLFLSGMTWNNKGRYGWHIDHIIPLSAFDLTDRKQFLQACNYTNLQPLWAEVNLSKSGKFNQSDFNKLDKIKPTEYKQFTVDKEKIKSLTLNGKSSYQISKEIGHSPSGVRYWIKKLGLKSKFNKQTFYECKCGELNKDNFYNKKTICKKCHNKLTYKYQKERRKNMQR